MNNILRLGFIQVTKEALEKLFKSLKTCPPATTEIQDPDGFVVRLFIISRFT